MSEPQALYMPLGDGKSDSFRLIFGEHLGGQTYRLLEEQPEDEDWRVSGPEVFAVEQDRPGMLVVVAAFSPAAAAAATAPSLAPSARTLRLALTTATVLMAVSWAASRTSAEIHPADPLRLGAVVSGLAALWWAHTVETPPPSRQVTTLLSIPLLLLTASAIVGTLTW